MNAAPEPFLTARELVKGYPGVVALNEANFDIAAGQVLGLVGKNGAGKSTLIKALAGAVDPDAGTITVDGEVTKFHDPHHATRRGLSFVHQELADVPNLTVAENIELGLGYPTRAGTLNRRALRAKARAVLERLGVDIDPRARVSTLSVAQRRMVMIARGLASEARLLVLDEPTAALSDEEIVHLQGIVRSLRDDGIAIVYVSHRLEEILTVTDSVLVMRDGREVFAAPTAGLTKVRLVAEITGEAGHDLDRIHPPHPGAGVPELLRLEGLSRDAAVRDVSFSLRKGEVLGIAGMVGAGRTELARLLFGADRPTAGRILVAGRPTTMRSPRDAMDAGVALLPEDRRHQGSIMTFSVRKNVTLASLPKYRRGALPVPNRSRERETARKLVDRLAIKVANVEHPVRYLSGGNQQKVVLAKWLERDADVFIFDEPTAGIDVGGRNDVYKVMEELAAAGKGVIFITSEFAELVGACSRVLVMREGQIIDALEGDEITEAALVERCYGRDAADAA